MSENVTIKTSSTRVELAKGLLKLYKQDITEEQFITLAGCLGYGVGHCDNETFIRYAIDEVLQMLS